MNNLKKIIVTTLLISVAYSGLGGCGSSSKPASQPASSSSTQATSSAQAKPAENIPTEYKNALKTAQRYNDMMHMSKSKLYEQLTSEYGEKFTPEAAEYAIAHVNADYKKNALATAKNYEKTMSMSPARIHDQLVSDAGERFTEEEAQSAVQNLDK